MNTSFNHGHRTKTAQKTLREWIVYKPNDNRGGLLYWTGEGWTSFRIDAKGFDDAASASALAEREGGTVARK